MTSHAQARSYARDSLRVRYGSEPSYGEIAALAGVAWLETNYSDGWKGAGFGSKNQGAVQCGSGWQGDRFSYRDTHPNSDGSSTLYPADFRKYPEFFSSENKVIVGGWNDLAQVVYVNRGRNAVRLAARTGDFHEVSRLMRSTGYYEGFGATVEDRIANHFRALSKAIAAADVACGKDQAPIPTAIVIPPTVRLGDTGEAVRHLQWELELAADGIFGTVTDTCVRTYQEVSGLTPDGIVGPQTWQRLLTDDYIPKAA